MEDWLKCQISPLLNIVKTSLHNTVLIRVLLDRNQCSSCPVMELLLQIVEHLSLLRTRKLYRLAFLRHTKVIK